jgi:hypothetical protein
LTDTATVTTQLNDLAEGVASPPPPPPPPPPPGPDPEPEPDDGGGDNGEVDLGGGDDGGGGNPTPDPEPDPEPTPEPEPVPEPVPEPEPVPVVAEAEPREVKKPEPTVVATLEDTSRDADTTTPFHQAMNIMSEGVGTSDIFEEIENNTVKVAFKGTSFVLSAGFLTWALRGASLLASVAASLPAWQGFDPLPVLAAKKRKAKAKDEDVDGDDEKSGDDWQEKRLQRLFNPIDNGGE